MKCVKVIGLIILLVPCVVTDFRNRTLPLLHMVICGVLGAAVNLLFGFFRFGELAAGLLPGIFLLMAAALSKGRIGYGDGILLIAVGLICGLAETLSILIAALLLAAAAGGVYLLVRKKPIGTELPFAPFVLAAAGAVMLLSRT